MADRFTRSRGRLGSKRATSWFDLPATSTLFTAAGGTILLVLSTAEKAKRPFTIIRTHLHYSFSSDQIAASEFYGGAVGMAIVSDQAAAIGVSAVPTPAADAASDLWFMHEWFSNQVLFGDGTGFQDAVSTQGRIDSKAMRKVDDSQDAILVAELDTVMGAGGFIFKAGGRLLIKEH